MSKHYNLKSITKIVAVLLIFTSCRSLVTDEFETYDSSPTVNCILIDGKPIEVNLTMTGSIDTLDLETIEDAEVELFVDSAFVETLEYASDGIYTSETVVEQLKNYNCKIAILNYDTLICSETLPESMPIKNIEHVNIAGYDEEGTSYPAIKVTFKTNTAIRQYFEIIINYYHEESDFVYNEENGEWDEIDLGKVQYQANLVSISDPVLLSEGLSIALFSNEQITDSVYTMTLNYTTGSSFSNNSNGGAFKTTLYPYTVELRTITYDYYLYKKQYYLYEKGLDGDGLLTPVTASPIYSNIDDAYGIFAGYSSVITDTLTPPSY